MSLTDQLVPVRGTSLHPDSYLGSRVEGNLQRLLNVNLDPLLAGFRSRPGQHPWIGEHIGKWMHAATLTWRDSRDARLEHKLSVAAHDLIATQEPDGYLGTYEPGRRFGLHPGADWDVWTHKYCLIGLLTYYEHGRDERTLSAARRAADLLLATFGDGDGQRNILDAGTHVGMAATSVPAPIVLLYRHTGDEAYLRFAEYIVRTWDADGGPRVRSTLLASGRLSEVGNGKAYETLSNIVGLAELARATGDAGHLTAACNAWQDVVEHHLYVTGTASFGEHFHRPLELPDSVSVNMGETCVTVTWLQLTAQLLALTGEARYAAELERTLFNHLAGAQAANGSAWADYTPLDGYREHGSGTSCCISSGPRGMALAPSSVMSASPSGDELAINLYQAAHAELELGGARITVRMTTDVPDRGGARIGFGIEGSATFRVRLRWPDWATGFVCRAPGCLVADGWVWLPERRYEHGDSFAVDFGLGYREVPGHGWNAGRVSLAWGPLVLAYRRGCKPPPHFDYLDADAPELRIVSGAEPWSVRNALSPGDRIATTLGPFACTRGSCRVWLNRLRPRTRLSAFHDADESQSSGDPRRASFNDYDGFSFSATYPGDGPSWFALRASAPVPFRRVVFVHGRSLVHGGWFDTSEGKPLVQIQAEADAQWQTLAPLAAYPATDAVQDGGLEAAQPFELEVDPPVQATGLRVIGAGACGEYPPRRFATCALLQAFE